MGALVLLLLLCPGMGTGTVFEKYVQENRLLSKVIVDAFQNPNFNEELLFDLKKDNQVHLNRTMTVVIKYIVKREVDNYRMRRTDAIGRRIYSSLIMKLIDIAKDIPRNTSDAERIETAHRYYTSVLDKKEVHDKMADLQVFHACTRLYEIMFTAPRIINLLGKLEELTPGSLLSKLKEIQVKPVHLAIALLIQYHLRNTINYALRSKAVHILSTKPQMVGPLVVETLKALASRLLPVAELLDIHIAHYSPAFLDSAPSTWLEIVKNKN